MSIVVRFHPTGMPIWDSQEKLAVFGERLMPILAEVAIQPGEPQIYEVQNTVKR